MMQSSPPQRPANGQPSPTTSQYSIDLATLECDSRSGASTPLPRQHVDQVLSEEIDGPSDFTQNMEAWMRGGTLRKARMPSIDEKKGDDDNAGLLNIPAKKDDEGLYVEDEDGRTASHHTPSNSPPKESVLIHRREGDEDEEGSSVWEPYAESQTPTIQHMDRKTGLLQPTVEEYFSELTPGRAASTQAAKAPTLNSGVDQQHLRSKTAPLQSDSRASSPTGSPKRSPIFQRSAPPLSHFNESSLQQELEHLRAQCQHLQNLNTTLNQDIAEERRARKEASAAHETHLADFARREQDFAEMKDQSHEHKEDFRREFTEMKEQIQQYEKQQEFYRGEIDRLHNTYGTEVKTLREQVESDKREHSHALRALEQDMELARRGRDDAEENARVHREELDEQIAEVDRLNMEIQRGEELREGIKEQLRNTMMEKERLASVKNAKEDAEKGSEALRQTKDDEIETLKTEHEGALQALREELEEMKRQVKQSENQRTTHEITSTETLSQEIDNLRKSYNTMLMEHDALQDDLFTANEALAAERTARQAEKEDYEVVNAALHDKISGAIRTREDYWRGRVRGMEMEIAELEGVREEKKALAEERRVMAKALLRGWGREELGLHGNGDADGSGEECVGHNMAESGWQMYEYLYAVASDGGKGQGEGKVKDKGLGRKVTFRGRDSFYD